MKRKILVGLIVSGTLTISGVLLATATRSSNPCDDLVGVACISAMDHYCSFSFQKGTNGEDDCVYRDHWSRGEGI